MALLHVLHADLLVLAVIHGHQLLLRPLHHGPQLHLPGGCPQHGQLQTQGALAQDPIPLHG